MYWEKSGAFTGEISAPLLRDLFVHYVVLGHSERRTLFGETDEMVNRKVRAAHEAETASDRLRRGNARAARQRQCGKNIVASNCAAVSPVYSRKELQESVIAYEPVWAIGTGRNATPQQAQEAHAFIRNILREMADDDDSRASADSVRRQRETGERPRTHEPGRHRRRPRRRRQPRPAQLRPNRQGRARRVAQASCLCGNRASRTLLSC